MSSKPAIARAAVACICALSMACAGIPAVALADTNDVGRVFSSGGITYKVTAADEVSVGSGEVVVAADHSVTGTDVVIPSTVSDGQTSYTVTSVAASAFQDDTALTSITIPATVKSIGQRAFSGCATMDESGTTPVYSGLRNVTFSGTPQLRYIGDEAFYSCYNMESFVIPASVQSLGYLSFANCFSFETLSFAKGTQITEIGKSAFEVEWQKGFAKPKDWTGTELYTDFDEEFAEWDFASAAAKSKHYGGLKSVCLPASVQIIRDSAFANQRQLANVTFEAESMKWIGDWAFAFCDSLEEIELPGAGYINSAEEGWRDGYGEYMLACCPNLKSCTFAGEIKAPTAKWICYRMFDGCVNLETVVFCYNTCVPAAAYGLSPGRYPTMIKWGYNSSDPTLYYGVSFAASKADAIAGKSTLGWAVIKDGTLASAITPGLSAGEQSGTVLRGSVPTPPSGYDSWAFVTRDGQKAYSASQGIDDVAFAYPVKSADLASGGIALSNDAFWYDGQSHTPSASVIDASGKTLSQDDYELTWERLGADGTWALTSDFTSVGQLRAVACGLNSYSGTATCEFSISYLAEGTTIQAGGITYVVSVAQNASSSAQLQVGDGENAAVSQETTGDVEIPASIQLEGTSLDVSVTSIAARAFGSDKAEEACTSITAVAIPEGITSIGDLAFANMAGLTSIELPASLKSIGASAFSHCTALASVAFDGTELDRIGTCAFEYCSRIKNIELPAITGSFLGLVFQNCVMLSSVTFTGDVNGSKLSQFDGCGRISSVTYLGCYWDYAWPEGTSIRLSCGTGAGKATYQFEVGSKQAIYVTCLAPGTKGTVPASIKVSGADYVVGGIAANAFKGSKVKAVAVKSTALTAASVKGCFKGSKVAKVSVPAKKKAAYKKAFGAKNAGKAVAVK